MAKREQTENASAGAGTAGIGADQGDSVPAPKPSGPAADAAGAVGPGALAAAEVPPGTSRPEEVGSGLTQDDVEMVRGLVRRAGGVEALIRWLELHRDLE